MLQFETFLTRYRRDSYVLGKVMRPGSSTVTDREQALSFGRAAALYESIRPDIRTRRRIGRSARASRSAGAR